MARFNANDADHYGGQGNGGGFFFLSDDGDTAQIRFMYEKFEDVEGLSVHQVEVEGKKRYVNCLREYQEPLDNCPFCRERMAQQAKVFVPIYDTSDGSVKVWERGKQFFSKLSSLCARYNPLVSHVMEIERVGKKGSTNTTYETYDIEHDDTRLSDLPELPKVIGGIVLDKTAEDMEYYLETGNFPPTEGTEQPVRRRNTEEAPRRRERRTPTNNGGNRF